MSVFSLRNHTGKSFALSAIKHLSCDDHLPFAAFRRERATIPDADHCFQLGSRKLGSGHSTNSYLHRLRRQLRPRAMSRQHDTPPVEDTLKSITKRPVQLAEPGKPFRKRL